MPGNAKTAETIGGYREIIVVAWKPLLKNTLTGFASVRLPSGIVIHGVTIHQKGESRWVSLPARSYQNENGATTWTPVVEIADRQTAGRFRDQVLAALDQYLEAAS